MNHQKRRFTIRLANLTMNQVCALRYVMQVGMKLGHIDYAKGASARFDDVCSGLFMKEWKRCKRERAQRTRLRRKAQK